jgi:spore coat polysaccharide biosynthesis predicted glycosyltransferase SpsG/RimJ/RimL family protein N-acetyltransferase
MTSPARGAPPILLRCDATEAGGIGHFVRCIALAQAVRSAGGREIHLSGDVTTPLAREMLAVSGVRNHPAVASATALVDLARSLGARVVHVDGYEGFDDLRAAGRAVDVVTSTATDADFGRRDADVIVDGSPRALRVFDELYGDASVALGPAYLALREQFAVPLPRARHREGSSVLVVMGGTDAAGYGPAVARAVAATPGVAQVGVIGAESSPSDGEEGGGAPIRSLSRRTDFAELVAGWDLVVTGAGTTIWELAALGVPMAVVGVAENQRDHYRSLVDGGLAVGLGLLPDPSRLDTRVLAEALADSQELHRMADAARSVVDGRGASRVVRLWLDEVRDRRHHDLHVRPMGLQDAGRLFAWRNDAETRRWSRSTQPVAWIDHLQWLRSVMADPDRLLVVGVVAGEPIGTARFDACSDGVWEVSVTIAPSARGRGLSARLVREATTALLDARPGAVRFVADIRPQNAASRAVFAGLGYVLRHVDAEWERWECDPDGFRPGPS